MQERPQLAKGLADFPWREDTRRILLPLHEELAPHLPGLTPLWTHNDWHASNLPWNEDGSVATALDFGMSDRTTAVHDLATAIERNTVQWLQPGFPVREEDALALLDGYRSVTPAQPHRVEGAPRATPPGPRLVRALRAGLLPRRDSIGGEHPAGVRVLRGPRGVVRRGGRTASAGPVRR
ncbi:phosphotransferase [Streptomyces sp. NPDC050549]|uniref:phosphotransferase n=1 Tax=Streptomyces sp. NPDC050549 TaxID=3155406 RepID=UPI0034350502